MKSYWVYMLRCNDASFYTGVTSQLDLRVAKHNLGLHAHAYTYTRRPVSLVYSQEFADPNEAIAAEKQLKGWSRAKKTALIAGDWNEIRQLAHSSPADKLTRRQAHPSTSSG